jgi:hypothetical protein
VISEVAPVAPAFFLGFEPFFKDAIDFNNKLLEGNPCWAFRYDKKPELTIWVVVTRAIFEY